jgi:hypothetical protein
VTGASVAVVVQWRPESFERRMMSCGVPSRSWPADRAGARVARQTAHSDRSLVG